MNGNLARTISTLAIWAAVTGLGITLLLNQMYMDGFETVVFTVLLLIGAMGSTRAIWGDGNLGATDHDVEKSKRRSRIEHLVSALDDSDLDELRARLIADDGEASTLEDLLRARESRSR